MIRILSAAAVIGALFFSPCPAWSQEVQDFELYDLTSRLVSTSRLRGQPETKLLALDFFSDSCKPCKKAIPEWKKLFKEYEKKGLQVVIVSVRQDDDVPTARKKLKKFFGDNPVPFPVVFDKYNMVAKQYGVVSQDGGSASLPMVYLVDKNGKRLLKTEDLKKAEKLITETLK